VAEDEYHGMADEQDLEMTAKGKYPEGGNRDLQDINKPCWQQGNPVPD
jgi:hypothetical protein